jgi:hypothetical protein
LIGFREARPGNKLDASRSIKATLQSAGDFVTVMRPRSRAVEFVFLIRRRHRHDHERARALRLVNALGNAGLTLTAYDYSPDPRFLTATGRVGAGALQLATTLDLRGLAERHFGAILVLVTDGDELLDPLTSTPLGFLERELTAWPRRMILTPTPSGAWGSREYRLAAALNAPVGRATLAGLADLALVFDPDVPEGKGRRPLDAASKLAAWDDRVACWRSAMTSMLAEDTLPVPPPMLAAADSVLVSDQKPAEKMIHEVIFSLKLLLGHGYPWFIASAMYSHLRFDLTLWLGANLSREVISTTQTVSSENGVIQMPLFSENLLDRLCTLPWFQQGRIPNWLRVAVFEDARPRERQAARAVIEQLLRRPEPGGAGGTLLPVWLADWRGQRLAADDTMIGFRYDGPIDARPPSVQPDWQRWIALSTARLVILVAWAGVASLLIPAIDARQSNGAWFPVFTFVATSLVFALLLMVPAVRTSSGRLYQRLAQRVARSTRQAQAEKALS